MLLTPAVRGILAGKHTSLLAYILSAAYIRPFHSSAAAAAAMTAAFIVPRPVQRASASILQDAHTLAIPVPRNHGRSYVVSSGSLPALSTHTCATCYVVLCRLDGLGLGMRVALQAGACLYKARSGTGEAKVK